MLNRFSELDMFPMLNEFRRRMEAVWDDYGQDGAWDGWPRAWFSDEGNALCIRADVPGLGEKDITLTLHQDVVTLSGERKVKAPEGYQVHRAERGTYRFSRSFSLPVQVDAEKVTATVKNGVLTVQMPKAPQAQPRQITVKAQ